MARGVNVLASKTGTKINPRTQKVERKDKLQVAHWLSHAHHGTCSNSKTERFKRQIFTETNKNNGKKIIRKVEHKEKMII